MTENPLDRFPEPARSGQAPAEQLAHDLVVHLSGTAGAIRAALPWLGRLPPADRAWLVGRIVLAADTGDTAGLVEMIVAGQDTPAGPPDGAHSGQRDRLPGPGGTGGVPRLTAAGLSARIRSELGGRGPGPEDLDA